MAVDIRNRPPPVEWGVTISPGSIAELAEAWKDRRFELPKWDYAGLPRGLDDAAWYDLCIAACSVLACIWPPAGEDMWSTHYEGERLEDAPAIFSCFSRRLVDGKLDPRLFSELTASEFFSGRGTLQLLDERWAQLNAVVATIQDRWKGTAINLVEAGGGDAEPIVDLLVTTIPGFRDMPHSPVGVLPFNKLARLATAMMSAGGSTPFTGLEKLPVYPDYMLPRVFRHYGAFEYSSELADAVDHRRLIPAGSEWELAIRWATVYTGDRLADALRSRGVEVMTPALDYFLWEMAVLGPDAAAMGEHHRTLTLAY